LGPLNYIRLWHNNSGQGASGSLFLKYIIIRDLQTLEKSYFISQQWFAVEKDDGRVRFLRHLSSKPKVNFRLNVSYQLRVNYKNENFLMFYQNKLIIVFLKVIFGFQSFLDLHQINSLVFNDVLVVLSYSSHRCSLIFFIMIKHKTHQQRIVVYHLDRFI
jgi:hypothetical protein